MLPVGTGFATVDGALGGLITGDNVVWICDADDIYLSLCRGFARTALANDQRVLHLSFSDASLPGLAGVEPLDAGVRSPFARPSVLADELDSRFAVDRPDCVIVDDLSTPMRRWGPAATLDFFSRTCPSMLQAGVTAYWSVGSGLGRTTLDSIRQITQCLIDVRSDRFRVLKAEGRPASQQGLSYRLAVDDAGITVSTAPTGGRLARGLVALRHEIGLTQHELATIGGVTASAISQAESGSRGLSVDTLLRISDHLSVPIDRLVNATPPPSYRLARHDRSRRVADDVVALVPDTTIGVRVFLVDVAGGTTGTPDQPHPGVEVIAVVRGLVQIELGEDRPVLRGGDALVVERTLVKSWRNLRREPAQFFRMLRD
ncbi:helix-turn-helix domain-containing protein [Ilumatobacter sp.]|uniref:helix-turn-helix domain-containing protein n=1 Tax=Ilumatobacter sp. TaxID=1967498 RepID=UPI003C4E6945